MIAGAFKPISAGHFALIEKAAEENDIVRLFVSTKDRNSISWNSMKYIWEKFIKPILPVNVKVYYVPNPVKALFKMLVAANDNPFNTNYFQLYADENDIKRFDNPRIRYNTLPRLFDNEQVEFRPLNRSYTQGVSGTQMRRALVDNDLEFFVSMLPEPIQNKGDIIFQLLGGEF